MSCYQLAHNCFPAVKQALDVNREPVRSVVPSPKPISKGFLESLLETLSAWMASIFSKKQPAMTLTPQQAQLKATTNSIADRLKKEAAELETNARQTTTLKEEVVIKAEDKPRVTASPTTTPVGDSWKSKKTKHEALSRYMKRRTLTKDGGSAYIAPIPQRAVSSPFPNKYCIREQTAAFTPIDK